MNHRRDRDVRKRPRGRGASRCCAILSILTGVLFAADAPKPVLELQVSSETVPTGGIAQFKIWATSPHLIAKGRIVMDFDPAVFGNVIPVHVFSAAGDALGTPTLDGRHLDVKFSASSGGIGRLPDLPVFVVAVPVLLGVAPGTTTTVTMDPTAGTWKDNLSALYSVTVKPGTLTVGGGLTIEDAEPGGGIMPAGTTVQIRGTGFTSATVLEVAGVSVSSVQFAGPQEIDFTLGAPAEMTGKRIRLRNPDGSQAEYYCWLRGPSILSQPNTRRAIFPLETAQATVFGTGNPRQSFALENQNPGPVDIIIETLGFFGIAGVSTLTLPSGGSYVSDVPGQSRVGAARIMASAPIRMLGNGLSRFLEDSQGISAYYAMEPMPGPIPSREMSVAPQSLSFDWQIGSAIPFPSDQVVMLSTVEEWQDFTVSTATTSGGPWLKAGSIEYSVSKSSPPAQLGVGVDPSALSAGTYSGIVTVSPLGFNIKPSAVNVSLTVRAKASSSGSAGAQTVRQPKKLSTADLPALRAYPDSLTFVAHEGGHPPPPSTVSVQPQVVSFTSSFSTDLGGDWLKAAFDGFLNVRVESMSLAAGIYHGTVTLTSPDATPGQIAVTLIVWSGPPPPIKVTPSQAILAAENGASVHQILNVDTGGIPFNRFGPTFTFDGGNWLGGYPTFQPSDLGLVGSSTRPGIHAGSVTESVDYGLGGVIGQVVVPVTLMVAAAPGHPPMPVTIVGAASQTQGNVAPGQIVTIHGLGVGPPNPTGLIIDSSDKVATNLGGVRVLFDGIPAPLLYASVSQTNLIVPYEVAVRSVTAIEVEYNGTRSLALSVPVAQSAPALFTLSGSGVGGAATLNQDNTVNRPENPAALGSVIQIFATGEGSTAPGGVTGAVTHTDLKKPLLPVSVTIGGVDAQVLYAGSAPEAVAGLFQVNAVVPRGVTPGPAVPIVLKVGSASSQNSVTIAVQ